MFYPECVWRCREPVLKGGGGFVGAVMCVGAFVCVEAVVSCGLVCVIVSVC